MFCTSKKVLLCLFLGAFGQSSQTRALGAPGLIQPKVRYQNIIFDVGNVLLDWNPAGLAVQVCAELGEKALDVGSIVQFVTSPAWKQWDAGSISRADLQAALPASCDRAAFGRFLDLMPYSFTPLAGVSLLRAIKARGYRVYVLSNMPSESLAVITKCYDFFKLFDGGVFSCEVHVAKPDAVIYQLLLQKYNLDPAECLFIDDVQKNIDAAKSIGIDGVVYKNYTYAQEELERLRVICAGSSL